MGSTTEVKVAFIIGNGQSRSVFDISKLSDHGVTYGCNLQIEETQLDNIVAVDLPVLVHLISQGYDKRTNLWTRKKWDGRVDTGKAKFLPDPVAKPKKRWDGELHWGSGTHAANLAATQGANVVVLLGFDLWSGNLYRGKSEFYSNKDPGPACWIYQFGKLFDMFPDVSFVQIQPKSWENPVEWTQENYSRDTYSGLRAWLKA